MFENTCRRFQLQCLTTNCTNGTVFILHFELNIHVFSHSWSVNLIWVYDYKHHFTFGFQFFLLPKNAFITIIIQTFFWTLKGKCLKYFINSVFFLYVLIQISKLWPKIKIILVWGHLFHHEKSNFSLMKVLIELWSS